MGSCRYLLLLFFYATVPQFACLNILFGNNERILYFSVDSRDIRPRESIDYASLEATLRGRIGDTGQVKILKNGQIEVRINDKADQANNQLIKWRVIANGSLVFSVAVDDKSDKEYRIIEQGRRIPKRNLDNEGSNAKIAEWLKTFAVEKDFLQDQQVVKRIIDARLEVLVKTSSEDLSGAYLTSAEKMQKNDRYFINFSFDIKGKSLLKELIANQVERVDGKKNHVLVLALDNRIIGSATLNDSKVDNIQIGGMTDFGADAIIAIVHAGMLPYRLNEIKIPK